jgi:tetratricopeptide (TPR) repeat protein
MPEDGRSLIETRLVRLYVDAERFAEAERHLGVARTLLARVDAVETWQKAEVDVAAARLAEACGMVDEAADLARRCCSGLRAALDSNSDPRIGNALIDALLLRATIAIGHGEFDAAVGLAASALQACDARRGVDPQITIAARSIAAMTLLFGVRDVAHAERELRACYRSATEAGLTREALVVATHLAGLYRHTKRPKLAVALLTPLVGSARLVGTRECAAGVFSEVVAANLEIGAQATAATYLADVHAYALGHKHMQPQAELLMARVHLAGRTYSAALGFARNAESGFARIGKERLAGSALRLQAEALAGLGQMHSAIDAAKRSIETLSGRSHPERLAAAYRVLGRLSGDPAHFSKARKLVRSAR